MSSTTGAGGHGSKIGVIGLGLELGLELGLALIALYYLALFLLLVLAFHQSRISTFDQMKNINQTAVVGGGNNGTASKFTDSWTSKQEIAKEIHQNSLGFIFSGTTIFDYLVVYLKPPDFSLLSKNSPRSSLFLIDVVGPKFLLDHQRKLENPQVL